MNRSRSEPPDATTIAVEPRVLDPVSTFEVADGAQLLLGKIKTTLDPNLATNLAKRLAGMDPWRRYGFAPDRLKGYFSPGTALAPRLLVTENDRVVAVCALKLAWMFGTYLNLLAVMPEHQGRGIGSAVLQWLERFARERGERNQFVVTSAFNTQGLALYVRHGFAPIAEMPGLIEDGEIEILLRKRIVAPPAPTS